MGSPRVVEIDVLPEHPSQVPRAQDHELVETFLAYRSHPALGNGIRLRSVQRRVNDFDANRLEGRIKASGELGVVIVDKEAYRHGGLSTSQHN